MNRTPRSQARLLWAGLVWAGLAGMAGAQVAADAPVAEAPALAPSPPSVPPSAPAAAGAAAAQVALPAAVLVLDVEQAYDSSAWGRRAQADLETAAREIEAENKRLEAQLTAEEQALTAERATLPPAQFRQKADEFDTRAQQVRRDRAEAVRQLSARAEADRNAFLESSLPVVTQLMQQNNAAIVLNRRQALLAISAVDITAELVRRMDDTVGAGGPLPDVPGATTPDTAAPGGQGADPADPAPATPPATPTE